MQVSGLVGRSIMEMYIRICLPKPADAQGWQKVLTFRKSPGGWTPLENSVAPQSALVSSVQAYSHVPTHKLRIDQELHFHSTSRHGCNWEGVYDSIL